jgi:hypothetical protein
VKSLVSAPGEWEWGSWVEKGGVGEFESARVYLARWARIVAEEGERARRREAQALPSVYADNEQEASSLGIFELLHTTSNLPLPKSSRTPEKPVSEKEWRRWFDAEGKPVIRVEEFKREVFRRGVSGEPDLRKKIWPFLLGVFEWYSTAVEREKIWQKKQWVASLLPAFSSFSQDVRLMSSVGNSINRSRVRGVVCQKSLIDRMLLRNDIASTWTADEQIDPSHSLQHQTSILIRARKRNFTDITQPFHPSYRTLVLNRQRMNILNG